MNNNALSAYIKDTFKDVNELGNKIKNNPNIRYRNTYYKIKKHIDDFLGGYVENRFITLAGLRGVGKTTLLLQIYNYLINEKNISKKRILYLSVDDVINFLDSNIYEVVNYFIEEFHETKPVMLDEKLFILIDEAQFDKKWSIAGKVLYDKTENIFFIFTGSSALNIEMNVDAVRRVKKEILFPLNFLEYNELKNNIFPINEYQETINNLIFKNELIDDAKKKEEEYFFNLLNLKKPLKKEWDNFLLTGGFPFGLKMEEDHIYRKTVDMITRIIENDIFNLKSFNTDTKSIISRIICYIGLQEPGGTSNSKLAKILEKSQVQIREILRVLEKTHLIFSVKPYGSGEKQIKKPWEYYFLCPSIIAAIRYRFGKFDKFDTQFLGLLAESYVASYLFKVKEEENYYFNLYYDPRKNGVDFLLDTWDNIIPVEVGYGKKDKKQIKLAINHYKSPYGIIISNTTSKIHRDDDIIYIPLSSIP
ncbi:MAG: AAA family ATPase [Methanobrevibacter sp.]|jgi:predicted AAA+ superfamily ATPase|nr:AAA family ATPase [Candidatus Methanoflexus mossambicus]